MIAPVQVSHEFENHFFVKAWEAVRHRGMFWGYPIALETVTLIYNKKLLEGSPPRELSQLVTINAQIKKKHPGATTILWDYDSAHYSWGILGSAGGYVFGESGTDYNVRNIGVATPGGVDGKPARPFVGVSAAYINRSSPNINLAIYYIQRYLLTDEGLGAMNQAKPIGVPALISLYRKMSKDSPLLIELNAAIDAGQVMPNIPEMDLFFSSVGAALQIATQGRASAQRALSDAAARMKNE